MPANDVNSSVNTEELQPPASVLRTLDFVRSRGARPSAPDAEGTAVPLGIGALGFAAEALARSLTSRSLRPMTLGSPDWLTTLLQRHRFATWSLGLPSLYYFHWLRAAEEAATEDAQNTSSATLPRPLTGRTPTLNTSSPAAAVPRVSTPPSWAAERPSPYPTPEFVLARGHRVQPSQDEFPSEQSTVPAPRYSAPQSIPLLANTLNATSVIAPMLTLHTATPQGKSAAWTEPSLMQFAHPELLAETVMRRAETPSRRSNEPAPERAADSPYMPVSYPPVPLASWLGVSASAPEKAYWEATQGVARPEFSPASSHLLVLPKLVADVRTQPTFDSPSENAFAALPRLSAIKTSSQVAGAASASVQEAQSTAIQPTRPSWPPAPMSIAVAAPVTAAAVSAAQQPREPATDSLDEPAAARRSPLAAAQTALEVVQRIGTQAVQTLRTLAMQPSFAEPSVSAAQNAPYFATLPSRLPLPRLRRTDDTAESAFVAEEPTFYGVPSAFGPVVQRAHEVGQTPTPSRPTSPAPVLLEQFVAQRHQPVNTGIPLALAAEVDGHLLGATEPWGGQPPAFANLPMPLVARARLAEQTAEPASRAGASDETALRATATTTPDTAQRAGERVIPAAVQQSPILDMTESVLTRAAALIGSLASSKVGRMAPAPATAEASGFGAPLAAVRSFLGQFILPRRRTESTPDTQTAGANSPITPSVFTAPFVSPRGQTIPAAAQPGLPTALGTIVEQALPQRSRTSPAAETQDTDVSAAAPSLPRSLTPAALPASQHPVDFSSGVTAKYLETFGETGERQSGVTAPHFRPNAADESSSPLFPAFSSFAAPLFRFLRLGNLRRSEAETAEVAQAMQTVGSVPQPITAQRPIFGDSLASLPFVKITGNTSATPTMVDRPSNETVAAESQSLSIPTMLSALAAPFLRFLRLSELHRDVSDTAAQGPSAVSAGGVSLPSEQSLPIFGGRPSIKLTKGLSAGHPATDQTETVQAANSMSAAYQPPMLSSSVSPLPIAAALGSRENTQEPSRTHIAGPFTTLPLPGLPRRSASETAGEGMTSGMPGVRGIPALSQSAFQVPTMESASETSPSVATVMQRILHRWAQNSPAPSVNRGQNWVGRFVLPKLPATVSQSETDARSGESTNFGASAEIGTGQRSGLVNAMPFARRQLNAADADDRVQSTFASPEMGDGETTSTFQAQMLAPIREFLLSTLSRILSPLETFGQTSSNAQAFPNETSREFQTDSAPNLVWWSRPTHEFLDENSGSDLDWNLPSFPALDLPAFSQSMSAILRDVEGLGTQRRQTLASPHQTDVARSGIQALRMAADRMSGPFMSQRQRSRVMANGAMRGALPTASEPKRRPSVTTVEQVGPLSVPQIERAISKGVLSANSAAFDSLREGLGLRPRQMSMLSSSMLLPMGQEQDETTEGPIQSLDRLVSPALTSLPIRPQEPAPVERQSVPAWASGRTGSAIAERVPAMPLPMRSDRSATDSPTTMRDPYVIQRAKMGEAVATPAPHSPSSAHDSSDSGQQDGGQANVQAMASQVWTMLRRKMALEATRAGNR